MENNASLDSAGFKFDLSGLVPEVSTAKASPKPKTPAPKKRKPAVRKEQPASKPSKGEVKPPASGGKRSLHCTICELAGKPDRVVASHDTKFCNDRDPAPKSPAAPEVVVEPAVSVEPDQSLVDLVDKRAKFGPYSVSVKVAEFARTNALPWIVRKETESFQEAVNPHARLAYARACLTQSALAWLIKQGARTIIDKYGSRRTATLAARLVRGHPEAPTVRVITTGGQVVPQDVVRRKPEEPDIPEPDGQVALLYVHVYDESENKGLSPAILASRMLEAKADWAVVISHPFYGEAGTFAGEAAWIRDPSEPSKVMMIADDQGTVYSSHSADPSFWTAGSASGLVWAVESRGCHRMACVQWARSDIVTPKPITPNCIWVRREVSMPPEVVEDYSSLKASAYTLFSRVRRSFTAQFSSFLPASWLIPRSGVVNMKLLRRLKSKGFVHAISSFSFKTQHAQAMRFLDEDPDALLLHQRFPAFVEAAVEHTLYAHLFELASTTSVSQLDDLRWLSVHHGESFDERNSLIKSFGRPSSSNTKLQDLLLGAGALLAGGFAVGKLLTLSRIVRLTRGLRHLFPFGAVDPEAAKRLGEQFLRIDNWSKGMKLAVWNKHILFTALCFAPITEECFKWSMGRMLGYPGLFSAASFVAFMDMKNYSRAPHQLPPNHIRRLWVWHMVLHWYLAYRQRAGGLLEAIATHSVYNLIAFFMVLHSYEVVRAVMETDTPPDLYISFYEATTAGFARPLTKWLGGAIACILFGLLLWRVWRARRAAKPAPAQSPELKGVLEGMYPDDGTISEPCEVAPGVYPIRINSSGGAVVPKRRFGPCPPQADPLPGGLFRAPEKGDVKGYVHVNVMVPPEDDPEPSGPSMHLYLTSSHPQYAFASTPSTCHSIVTKRLAINPVALHSCWAWYFSRAYMFPFNHSFEGRKIVPDNVASHPYPIFTVYLAYISQMVDEACVGPFSRSTQSEDLYAAHLVGRGKTRFERGRATLLTMSEVPAKIHRVVVKTNETLPKPDAAPRPIVDVAEEILAFIGPTLYQVCKRKYAFQGWDLDVQQPMLLQYRLSNTQVRVAPLGQRSTVMMPRFASASSTVFGTHGLVTQSSEASWDTTLRIDLYVTYGNSADVESMSRWLRQAQSLAEASTADQVWFVVAAGDDTMILAYDGILNLWYREVGDISKCDASLRALRHEHDGIHWVGPLEFAHEIQSVYGYPAECRELAARMQAAPLVVRHRKGYEAVVSSFTDETMSEPTRVRLTGEPGTGNENSDCTIGSHLTRIGWFGREANGPVHRPAFFTAGLGGKVKQPGDELTRSAIDLTAHYQSIGIVYKSKCSWHATFADAATGIEFLKLLALPFDSIHGKVWSWTPMEGRAIKFGKTLKDPREIYKTRDYELAFRSFMLDQAKGLEGFTLGPVFAAMKRYGYAAAPSSPAERRVVGPWDPWMSEEDDMAQEWRPKAGGKVQTLGGLDGADKEVHVDDLILSPMGQSAYERRYDLYPDELRALTDVIDGLQGEPALVASPVWNKLAVDYA